MYDSIINDKIKELNKNEGTLIGKSEYGFNIEIMKYLRTKNIKKEQCQLIFMEMKKIEDTIIKTLLRKNIIVKKFSSELFELLKCIKIS